MSPEQGLLAAGALHAGFQATVTAVVYPALRDLRTGDWAAGHAAHVRRIGSVVAPVYAVVVAACAWALWSGPVSWAVAVAVGGHALALAVTAFVAAPLHGRLGRESPDRRRLDVLLLADRVRLLGALLAAGAAVLAATYG